MKKKIEIKDIFGKILFTYECENNSVKKTVEEAVRQNISLCNANLYCVDLRGANLHGADLRSANLYNAILNDANLNKVHLNDAKVCWANLCDTDLYGADLHNADLRNANLNGAKNIPFIPLACPCEGPFIAWKKVDNCIIKLFIPEDAKRSSATTNKCRCDKAKVLEITNLEANKHIDEVINYNYARCVYKVGKMVYPDKFDDNRWIECSHGIHFFMNKKEAIEY